MASGRPLIGRNRGGLHCPKEGSDDGSGWVVFPTGTGENNADGDRDGESAFVTS